MAEKRGIKPIAALFEKYTKVLIAPQSAVVSVAVEVVEDICGFKLETRSFRYSPQTRLLSLQVPGPQKSEIMLHKTEILLHLKGRLGEKNTPANII